MTTEQRIEKLEKQLAATQRRNRWIGASVGILLVFGCLVMLPEKALTVESNRSIRANEFLLEDADGKIRATLAVFKGGPALVMRDADGKHRIALDVLKDGPGLIMFDEDGKNRAELNVLKDGPGLLMLDENGKRRAELNMVKNPSLIMFDEDGKKRAVLDVLKDGPSLRLLDEDGTPRATLGTGRTRGKDGRVTTYPESSLRLFDPDGYVSWDAPR